MSQPTNSLASVTQDAFIQLSTAAAMSSTDACPIQARAMAAVMRLMGVFGSGGLDTEKHSKETIMAVISENYTDTVTVDYTTAGVSNELFRIHTGHEELYAFLSSLLTQLKYGEGWTTPEFHSAPGSNRVILYHGDACEWIVNGTSGVVSGTMAVFIVDKDGMIESFKQYHADGNAMEAMFASAW
eukprot:CAMPEP_0198202754 /NCGR_PEP_ID=MMETSP1445-20131203/5965_1 /TAXON_ID=36898 /ORGANISM="Pyramimonas sp., Strain CCMP2087" /LENGTH=184 /DNA_ID=CAMNT_0043873831 /DNA_START=160 /DNA_END=711 /DNA_ORIENTATION=+